MQQRWLRNIVYQLALAADAQGRLVFAEGNQVQVALSDGTTAIIIAFPEYAEPRLFEDYLSQLGKSAQGTLHIAVLGGAANIQDLLTQIQPRFSFRSKRPVYHVNDAGQLWCGPRTSATSPLARVIADAIRPGADAAIDITDFNQRLQDSLVSMEKDKAEMQRFREVIRTAPPRATYGLLAILAAVFLIENWFGGSQFTPTLMRMGANAPQKVVEDGEVWRLLAATFLHGGEMHVMFNCWVLFALGTFLERLYGTSRFLILYVLSGLGGSLASVLVSRVLDGALLSVGASGALWGFLVACAALAFRPGKLVPRSLVAPLKRTALINLGLNVVASFAPRIDIAAHFGGGLVGLVLVGTGLLSHGLEPGALTEGARQARRRTQVVAGAVAAALSAVAVASFAMALNHGEPWRLVEPAPWLGVPLRTSGFVVELPDLLLEEQEAVQESDGTWRFLFGDQLTDPVAVEISMKPLGAAMVDHGSSTELLNEVMSGAYRSVLDLNYIDVVGPRLVDVKPWPYVQLEERGKSGYAVSLWRFYKVTPGWLHDVKVIEWKQASESFMPDKARVIESLMQR